MNTHNELIQNIKRLIAQIKSTDHGDSVRHAARVDGDRAAFHAHVDDLIDKDHPKAELGNKLRGFVDHPDHQTEDHVRSAMATLHDEPVHHSSPLVQLRGLGRMNGARGRLTATDETPVGFGGGHFVQLEDQEHQNQEIESQAELTGMMSLGHDLYDQHTTRLRQMREHGLPRASHQVSHLAAGWLKRQS